MRRRQFLLAPFALAAACQRKPTPGFHNTDITGASFGRQLELPDSQGRTRRLADFHGKVVVLFFGYTSCPDICPTTMAKLVDVMRLLGQTADDIQVLFVTLDPERDSPAKLAEYVGWFDPRFIGLRGDQASTDATTREFRVFGARRAVNSALGYVIDHSSGAYVIDPAGRLRLHIGEQATPKSIAEDLSKLLAGD